MPAVILLAIGAAGGYFVGVKTSDIVLAAVLVFGSFLYLKKGVV